MKIYIMFNLEKDVYKRIRIKTKLNLGDFVKYWDNEKERGFNLKIIKREYCTEDKDLFLYTEIIEE